MGKGQECGHYCHPSAPQMWLFSVYRTCVALVKPLHQHTTLRLSARLGIHAKRLLSGRQL